MFPGFFTQDNPWYSSWGASSEIEDAQTIPTDTLFDNDMSSDPGDHTNGATTPTHSQGDPSPFSHTQPDAIALITPFEPSRPSESSSRKCVKRDSSVEAGPDVHTDPGEDSVVSSQTFDKCRHEEVDYSQSLRETLHNKREAYGRLRTKMREQEQAFKEREILLRQQHEQQQTIFQQRYEGMYQEAVRTAVSQQSDAVVGLQSLLKEREGELSGVREVLEKIQSSQQETAQQHGVQLTELRKQFELNMQSQIEQLQAARTAEIETRVQEEMAKLSATLRAEKERELANIDQRYSRLKSLHLSMEDTQAESPPTRLQEKRREAMDTPRPSSQRRSQAARPLSPPSTPTLDAIKRIRKSRGVSMRTRLIHVNIDDSGPELFEEHKHEENERGTCTPHDQSDPLPVSGVVDAITKNVEATLKALLGSGSQFSAGAALRNSRRSPRRRKQENYEIQLEKAAEPSHHRDFVLGEVRRLLKDKLGITQDDKFITHNPADTGDVRAYEYEDGPVPDTDNIAFDLMQNYSSPWNRFILQFLLQELQMRCDEEAWPIRKKDNYIEEILQQRYKRLRTLWRNARPRLTAKGLPETPNEIEARLVERKEKLGKESRQATRRRNKYRRREMILDTIIAIKSEDLHDDLPSWKWLQRLIKSLGEDGMSSEESSVENSVTNVLRVKNMDWRRNIEKEPEIIDLQRVIDKDIFSPQGSRPLPRKRAPDNPVTSRDPVMGLPKALYDSLWMSELNERHKESLKISGEKFPWMKVVVA